MKDWAIKKGVTTGQWELVHLACDSMWISTPNDDGEWECIGCKAKAPEEVAFCADLARCRQRIGEPLT